MANLTRFEGRGIGRRSLLRAGAAGLLGLALPRRARAARGAERALHFYQTHTGESTRATYFAGGEYLPEGLARIDRALRDHRSGEVHPIDPRLLELLYDLAAALDTREPIHVISGYRSAATNAMLAALSPGGVSPRSLHLQGQAIDLRIPGRSLAALRRAALALRAGGVGSYPGPDFVHVDVGRVRAW